MRRKIGSALSPVLLELLIVILFFALSSAAVLQLIAAAAETSRRSEAKSEALIAAIDLMESVKAEPDCETPERTIRTNAGSEIRLLVKTQRTETEAGTMLGIEVSAVSEGEVILCLNGSQYLPGEGAA